MNKTILTPIHIRFKDIDVMGHVNNAVHITFFEEARKAFLEQVLGISETSEYALILAAINCEYLIPLCLNDNAILEIWVADIGKKSFRFKYKIFKADEPDHVFSKGDSVMVAYNYHEKHSILIPSEFIIKVKDYSESK